MTDWFTKSSSLICCQNLKTMQFELSDEGENIAE